MRFMTQLFGSGMRGFGSSGRSLGQRPDGAAGVEQVVSGVACGSASSLPITR
jgi:hypothetical protein